MPSIVIDTFCFLMTSSVVAICNVIARNSLVNWALADQAMVSGSNFLTGILLARFLGIEAFGVFTLAWMLVQFISGIQSALILSPMMSIGPKQAAEQAQAYYVSVMAQQAIFSSFCFVLVWGAVKVSGVYFPVWQVAKLALPLASATFAFLMQDFARRFFFTIGRYTSAFLNDAVVYLGQLFVIIYFILSVSAMHS